MRLLDKSVYMLYASQVTVKANWPIVFVFYLLDYPIFMLPMKKYVRLHMYNIRVATYRTFDLIFS